MRRRFLEFFAGDAWPDQDWGLVGLALWAKDVDVKKCASYACNWSAGDLLQADVAELTSSDLPGPADLAWASLSWPGSVADRIRKWKRASPPARTTVLADLVEANLPEFLGIRRRRPKICWT